MDMSSIEDGHLNRVTEWYGILKPSSESFVEWLKDAHHAVSASGPYARSICFSVGDAQRNEEMQLHSQALYSARRTPNLL